MGEAALKFDGWLPEIVIGQLHIPTYHLWISLTYCVCIVWGVRRARRLHYNIKITLDVALALLIGGFVGARLNHVLFEDFSFYLANPWDVFKVWNGGFVFYGGAVVGFFSGLAVARYYNEKPERWFDFCTPPLSLGYTLGRMACLMTGCCFGEVCRWSEHFSFRHPTQLYAVLWEAGLLLFLLKNERRWSSIPGRLFFIWLGLHSLGRILMEYFRADDRGFMPLGMSQGIWLSLVFIVISGLSLWRQARLSTAQTKVR